MQRGARLVLAGWFAVSMTVAQSCMTPPANTMPPAAQGASPIGSDPHGSASAVDPPDPVAETHIDTTGYSPDQSESRALTDYLTQHRLPLVGAQVLNGPDGKRAIVLYGFVGSEFGRSDAATKARRFTDDSSIAVDNRIKVRPEILRSKLNPNPDSAPPVDAAANPLPEGSSPDSSSASSSSPDGSSPDASYPGVNSYVQQQNNAMNQSPAGQMPTTSMGSMMPLIMMLGILSAGMASGGSSFNIGPGMGGSPFGYSPSNPYSGYPSGAPPYGSSPYGGGSGYGSSGYGSSGSGSSGYGSSGYGSPPYGTSPYGSSPYNGPGAGPPPYP
jgi:hypothetical protein